MGPTSLNTCLSRLLPRCAVGRVARRQLLDLRDVYAPGPPYLVRPLAARPPPSQPVAQTLSNYYRSLSHTIYSSNPQQLLLHLCFLRRLQLSKV